VESLESKRSDFHPLREDWNLNHPLVRFIRNVIADRVRWFAWEPLCVPISPFSGRPLDPRLYNTNESAPTGSGQHHVHMGRPSRPLAINRCRLAASSSLSLSLLVCWYLNEYITRAGGTRYSRYRNGRGGSPRAVRRRHESMRVTLYRVRGVLCVSPESAIRRWSLDPPGPETRRVFSRLAKPAEPREFRSSRGRVIDREKNICACARVRVYAHVYAFDILSVDIGTSRDRMHLG